MRQEALVPCQPRPFRVTTEADAEAAAAIPDLVKRDFTADRPGVKFVSDIVGGGADCWEALAASAAEPPVSASRFA